jgi:hypothetical protein
MVLDVGEGDAGHLADDLLGSYLIFLTDLRAPFLEGLPYRRPLHELARMGAGRMPRAAPCIGILAGAGVEISLGLASGPNIRADERLFPNGQAIGALLKHPASNVLGYLVKVHARSSTKRFRPRGPQSLHLLSPHPTVGHISRGARLRPSVHYGATVRIMWQAVAFEMVTALPNCAAAGGEVVAYPERRPFE